MACYQKDGPQRICTAIPSTSQAPASDGSHTLYHIQVSLGEASWSVCHRYSDFSSLHQDLVLSHALPRSLLPPKRLLGNRDKSFVEQRRTQLQEYLSSVVGLLQKGLPTSLARFLDLHRYEVSFLLRDLAQTLYETAHLVESQSNGSGENDLRLTFTPLELHALSERTRLPLPPLETCDKREDLSHVLEAASRLRHLQLGGSEQCLGSSNIVPNRLPFHLDAFKAVEVFECRGARLPSCTSAHTLRKTVRRLAARDCGLESLSQALLCDSLHVRTDAAVQWTQVEEADFGDNLLTAIDSSVGLVPRLQRLCLAGNRIGDIAHLIDLPHLRELSLASNDILALADLHLKLGNVVRLDLSQNQLQSLSGFSRLYSLVDLDLSCNRIDCPQEVGHLRRLQCLESLQLTGNPVATVVDFRIKVFHLLVARIHELALDNERASQKEADTVAVLRALDAAKERVSLSLPS